MQLKNKHVIITGGGQGIGREFAIGVAEQGASVVIAEINLEKAGAVADDINMLGGDALAIHTDVSDPASVNSMVAQTIEKYGRIDVLVNNAAIYYGLQMKPFDELSIEEWKHLMAVNVDGIFYCARAAVPHMRKKGSGRIVNIASGAFHLPVPGISHYIASKGAVIGFTRALACELGDAGITVNAIAPGFVMTEASKVLAGPEMAQAIASRQCIKRSQEAEDLVGALIFLASDDSAFFTGQTMTVDGGTSFH